MNFKQFIKKRVFQPYSSIFANKRKELIKLNIKFNSGHKILDLGGSDGSIIVNSFFYKFWFKKNASRF